MKKQTRRWIWLGFASAILTFIGLAGVPDDVNTWLRWIDVSLKMINHDAARWLCLGLAVIVCLVIFYPPERRKWMRKAPRLGQSLHVIACNKPLLSCGWVPGNSQQVGEPTCSTAKTPNGETTTFDSLDRTRSFNFKIDDLDPTAHYVEFRGQLRPLYAQAFGFRFGQSGVKLHVYLRVRRRTNGQEKEVTLHLSDRTLRFANTDEWLAYADFLRNPIGWDAIIFDVGRFFRKRYGHEHFEFLGVAGVGMTIASATFVSIKVHQQATLVKAIRTALSRETWAR
jgi:hypothetical protein